MREKDRWIRRFVFVEVGFLFILFTIFPVLAQAKGKKTFQIYVDGQKYNSFKEYQTEKIRKLEEESVSEEKPLIPTEKVEQKRKRPIQIRKEESTFNKSMISPPIPLNSPLPVPAIASKEPSDVMKELGLDDFLRRLISNETPLDRGEVRNVFSKLLMKYIALENQVNACSGNGAQKAQGLNPLLQNQDNTIGVQEEVPVQPPKREYRKSLRDLRSILYQENFPSR